MLVRLNGLMEFSLLAEDKKFGKVKDLLFDDAQWKLIYLVVDMNPWIFRRKVIISTSSISGEIDRDKKGFPVCLTTYQIKNAPHVDTNRPISREKEIELNDYYKWPAYWNYTMEQGTIAPTVAPIMKPNADPNKTRGRENHLRSVNELNGYSIEAIDGHAGYLEDFIADGSNWYIPYLLVKNSDWLPGKLIIVPMEWVEILDWEEKKINVRLTRDCLQHGPQYNADEFDVPGQEALVDNYYSRFEAEE
jgi:hypothetical protein